MSSTMPIAPFRPLDDSAHRVATVIVAVDGTEQSNGALRVAMARAEERGAHLLVLTVATEEPLVAPETPYALWSEANAFRRKTLRETVEAQLIQVGGGDRSHAVTVLDGNPAHTISRVATEQRAALVVVGLGRHQVVDRIFSDETALQLARIARIPVLAVPSNGRAAPRHAVVAVDFSELSERAAQAAIEAVGDRGTVELVHVMPYASEDAFSVEAKEPYERWVEAQLAALESQLVVPDGVTICRVALRGRPAPTLINYAAKVDADLIATGTHGRGFVARTLLGSVTSQLIRAATCAVLTVPRDPLPGRSGVEHETRDRVGGTGPLEWSNVLADFTARNVGRRTILEVDDLEIGAQAQEYNYPLIAAMYDPRERRLQIMLGDRTVTGRRLSRSIGGVVGVDVLTDGGGHDTALRVEHGTSQTLLTFAP